MILAMFNFTPVGRSNYRVGVPRAGLWKEILNSDTQIYGGSNQGTGSGLEADPHAPSLLLITTGLAALSAVFFANRSNEPAVKPMN